MTPVGDLVRVHGGGRAWVAPGIDLAWVAGPDGNADRLLGRIDCRLLKMQRKVRVGRVTTPAGVLYVKRYNVFSWRIAVASLGRRSPAQAAWEAAQALRARAFATPDVVAAIEFRSAGLLRRSFFVTREVPDAMTADVYLQAILRDQPPPRRGRARRALARVLGDLFRRLHTAGVYHADLKDVNVLIQDAGDEPPRCVLLDLERVRIGRRVGRRRRLKNLVQLARTLGRYASASDRTRFLHAYLGDDGSDRRTRRAWARAVARHVARKERGRRPPASSAAVPSVSCTIVCQNEEAAIAACLDSVRWCDEVVVVDGGSTDRTVEIAHGFSARVLHNPWPGYRLQKQFALDASTMEWVLNLDADERVTPELAAEIRTALATVPPGVHGFAIPRLVCYLGRWWYHGDWYPRRVRRLVRRTATRWGGVDPHERAEVDGKVVRLQAPILHYTYPDIAGHLRSANRLTDVAAVQPEVRHRRVGAARLLVEPAWRFVRAYLVKGAWREGLPGLFVAATGAFYVFLRWAKVREAGAGSLDPREGRS